MSAAMFNGDCRDLLDPRSSAGVIDFLANKQIDCVLTDPPYGMAYKSTYGKDPEARELYQAEIEDDLTVEQAIESFDTTVKLMLPHLADVCELYVFSDWGVSPDWQRYLESLEAHGLVLRQLIIWEKGYPGIGDVKYNWGQGHEFIYYLKKGRRKVPYRRSAILHVDKVRPGTNVHPTQKPVELLEILIKYSTVEGQMVFDPYAGSGSTLVAARECGRDSIGIEKNKGYYEAAKRRLSEGGLFSL